MIAAAQQPGAALLAWLDELAVGMLQVRRAQGAARYGRHRRRPRVRRLCARGGDPAGAGRAGAGALRPDVEPVEVLRLLHGVVTAAEAADEVDGTAVRRYLSLLVEGLGRD
ncbi:TetR/AcrR family transcriptional regulator OS=Streptomyces tendae OX=1932 GN=GUR47_13050 PE=4 SV=1 [Streptomyces tendae]